VRKKPSKAYTDISLDIQEEDSKSEEDSSASQSKRNDRDSLELAEELKIPDNEDVLSELSAKINEIKKPTKSKILVDLDIAKLISENEAMLAASFKLINKKLDM